MFVLAWWVWSACMSLVPERDKGGVCHPHRRNDRNNSQLAFRPPPILYACPGAGANEFRVMLDAALMNAGYLSGSMHAEKNLLHDLPGEKHCHPVIFFLISFAHMIHCGSSLHIIYLLAGTESNPGASLHNFKHARTEPSF